MPARQLLTKTPDILHRGGERRPVTKYECLPYSSWIESVCEYVVYTRTLDKIASIANVFEQTSTLTPALLRDEETRIVWY